MTPGHNDGPVTTKEPGTPHTVPYSLGDAVEFSQITTNCWDILMLRYTDSQLDETIPNAMLMVITKAGYHYKPPPPCPVLIFEF